MTKKDLDINSSVDIPSDIELIAKMTEEELDDILNKAFLALSNKKLELLEDDAD